MTKWKSLAIFGLVFGISGMTWGLAQQRQPFDLVQEEGATVAHRAPPLAGLRARATGKGTTLVAVVPAPLLYLSRDVLLTLERRCFLKGGFSTCLTVQCTCASRAPRSPPTDV